MYQAPFASARAADYFQKKESEEKITEALKSDLPRFLPQNILAVYQEKEFAEFISTVSQLTSDLSDQGMKQYLDHQL